MRNAPLYSPDLHESAEEIDDGFETAAEAERRSGALQALRPRARRGYSLLKGRRTRFQSRRRTGKLTPLTPVHRGEREIIARD